MSFDVLDAYIMPRDREKFDRKWMTPATAAKKWGCSRATAYRLIDQYPGMTARSWVWICKDNSTKMTMVVPVHIKKPKVPRGNPAFRDSRYQSETARIREARRRNAHPHS